MSMQKEVAALYELITQIYEIRQARAIVHKSTGQPVKVVSGADFLSGPILSKSEQRIAKILLHPHEGALLLAVDALGVHIYEAGGDALMHDVCHEVCWMAPFKDNNFADEILDLYWDGIGEWCS